jgi:hypothetical protein
MFHSHIELAKPLCWRTSKDIPFTIENTTMAGAVKTLESSIVADGAVSMRTPHIKCVDTMFFLTDIELAITPDENDSFALRRKLID